MQGWPGTRDLENGTRAFQAGQDYKQECFPHRIAFNCIPQIGGPKHWATPRKR